MNSYAIAIHGGAGTILKSSITPELELAYLDGLKAGLVHGQKILASGGDALEAVMASVVSLEDNPLFNAGKGSVFTHNGLHEMDASIMCGKTLKAGAVAGVKRIKNPVKLANTVMEKTAHVFLYGDGAEALAEKYHLDFEEPVYFHDTFRYNQWLAIKDTEKTQLDHISTTEKKFGTVGAVALDKKGNLAAATSTGGMTNKQFSRIGDTPIIGAGNYANNKTCAISCTGHGEYFIRAVVAYDISCLMEYKGLSLEEACKFVINDKLVKMGGEGGLIAVDSRGNIALPFNSAGMYRASIKQNENIYIGIYE